MTTDITELAQSEINDALAQLKQISEYPTPSTQYARVLRKYILALVEALEKAKGMEAYWKTQCRGITDHCEELQAHIAELEREQEQLRPVGVMSEQAFHRLENRECRFIALWPRPGIFCSASAPRTEC
ncbi:hypothetical protein [Klebsiella pneumoniae]|uniref:hypothetical protein n=1 Tax=Klebsiella pneumoniae TaxID=573 RepID=UPI00388FF99B